MLKLEFFILAGIILFGISAIPNNAFAQDCDIFPELCFGPCGPFNDFDGDGWGNDNCSVLDCDDSNASVYPGAPEIIDGIDNNCDGLVDDEIPDTDGDGVLDPDDICQGFNDNIDTDNDGIPNGCDSIPLLSCGSSTMEVNFQCVPDLEQICGPGTTPNFNTVMCIVTNMGNMVGGTLMEINTVSLLVANIGVNPVLTGLVGITIASVTGQVAWFIHRRRKSKNS